MKSVFLPRYLRCSASVAFLLAGLSHAQAQNDTPKSKTPIIKLSNERGTAVDVTGLPPAELESCLQSRER